jgi:pilus assembly protein Flp/PilA
VTVVGHTSMFLRVPSTSGRRRESGVTSIEYALIGALLSVAIAGAVSVAGQDLLGLYEYVVDEIRKVTCNTVGCP